MLGLGLKPELICLIFTVYAEPQGINFGGGGKKPGNDINNKLQGGTEQCCCLPQGLTCEENVSSLDDLVGLGLINERIVNRPGGGGQELLSCGRQQRLCCYNQNADYDYSVFERGSCSPPQHGTVPGQSGGGYPPHQGGIPPSLGGILGGVLGGANRPQSSSGRWTQGCNRERLGSGSRRYQCGTRPDYRGPTRRTGQGEASAGEFPWTCLLLNQENDFIGTCALVPENSNNDLARGTRKVLTAAHNLKKIGVRDRVKVRVGEYDASGYNKNLEGREHIEYTVDRIVKHPKFDSKRLSNDIAVLKTHSVIDLSHPMVSTACYPSCDQQFGHIFPNQTGVRCWTAGWGKDEFTGDFQYIQHKVDVPLVPDYKCEPALKQALNAKKFGVGDRFKLHPSEVCAGTETGKDACTGDGGSPLVCQAESGRWTVVGLVAWGIGCATHLPGIYTNVAYFRNWIDSIV